ncbi:sulfite exporter TauE/SafE family protein [Rhodovulum sp. YNF3179]|uniref:sulfite exporter TauE/SafE family protein n=1 Tax=Rhodovulum sp. YNF3179 TaxID=3425127 RepID=UPI003D359793
MTLETVVVILLGGFCGGFVTGLAGFGLSLFALSWWLQVMPPVQAVPAALVMSVVSGLQGVYLVRTSVDWPRLLRFLLPALLGIPLGLMLLDVIDSRSLKLVIAGFLILYGGFFAFRRELPNLTRPTPVIDGGIGFVSGFLGAVAGLSGALPTMWSAMRRWGKSERRALLQPFNVAILGISAAILAVTGDIGRQSLITMALALPVTIIATQIGILVFKRVSDTAFQRLVIVLMFISGLGLMLRELMMA